MILHLIISNDGGMKRVFNTRLQHPDYYVGVYSKEPVKENSHLFWIPDVLNIKIEDLHTLDLTPINDQIKKSISGLGIKIIVCDALTYPLVQDLGLPFVVDVHTLGRPLYNAINASVNRARTNSLLRFPEIIALEFLSYTYLASENMIFKKCSGFVSNSKNSTRYLHEQYFSKEFNRPIFEFPVVTDLHEGSALTTAEKTIPSYIFSRWHPQKGFDNVFFEDWSHQPLYIRGLERHRFKEEALADMAVRGIRILEWTNDDSVLREELLASDLVVFPSLYEPYGLALNEAMSLGCICVANLNKSGHEEQIRDGVNGFLLDMSVPGWTAEIQKIRNLPESEKLKIRRQAIDDSSENRRTKANYNSEFISWLKDLVHK